MADRTTKVTLVAQVNGYVSGMQQAARATKAAADAGDDTAKKLQRQKEAFESVGRAALGFGALVGAGVVAAVKTFADFDAQMSQVQSLSHATAAQMSQLREAALTMGQGIGFSATQVADAETELVKAGVSVKDQIGGGLVGALNLAAAGQIDVGEATQIAATAMTQFHLAGKDVPHLADLLAAGADKALGGVDQLGQALNQSGLVAAQFGLSVDDTVGSLAAFANAGLLGSDAGTSFKTMLLQLANPSQQTSETMKRLGLNFYDAKGQFIGITGVAGVLQSQLKGLTQAQRNQALAQIFGNDGIRTANVLYQQGASGIRKWIDSVNDTGFAAQQARGKMDNLNGDLNKLGAAFQSDLIRSGSGANSVLRELTQGLTGVLQVVGSVPAPVLSAGLAVAALVAGVALLGGGFLILVPKIAATRAAMEELNLTGGRLSKIMGKGGGVFLALTAAVSILAATRDGLQLTTQQVDKLYDSVQGGKDTLNKAFSFDTEDGKVRSFGQALEFMTQKGAGVTNAFANAAASIPLVGNKINELLKVDGVRKASAQFTELSKSLADLAKTDFSSATKQFNEYVKQAGGGREAVERLLKVFPEYRDELEALASSQGKTLNQQELLNLAQGKGELAATLAAKGTSEQSKALAELQGKAADAGDSISDLADKINDFGKATFDTDAAQRDLEDAVDSFTKSLQDNGSALNAQKDNFDISTEAGRSNQAALEDIASSTLKLASAQVTQTGDTQTATAAIAAGRDQFIKAAEAAGLSADAANAYADKLGLIPGNVSTAFQTPGADAANQKAQDVRNAVNNIPSSKVINMIAQDGVTPTVDSIIRQNNGRTITLRVNSQTYSTVGPVGTTNARAAGGYISGPGTGTSDSIPARLSNGEFVVKASAVAQYGRAFLEQVNSQRFAGGGYVRPRYEEADRYASTRTVTRERPTNTFNISSPADPNAVAIAVARRQNSLGV